MILLRGLSIRKFALSLLVLLLPISVSAGVVSIFFNTIFKDAQAEKVEIKGNVQNMSLLASVITPSGAGAHNPVVDQSVLVSDFGPMGSLNESFIHKPKSDQISVYVVREGDTLSQVAEMFDVNVNTIKWGNDLSSNVLKPGQILVILPISGVKHTVVNGDTIDSLAKKYKGDKDEIISYNNIVKGENLVIGSVVIIPDGEIFVSTGNTSPSSPSLKNYSGFYIRPIVGGRRSQGIHGYNAIDIAAPVGTEILASADGEVIISRSGGWNGGYGSYIVIRHSNGTQTLYAHNSQNIVSAGDVVNQGQIIGFVGKTGKATGSHLHFEIRGAKNPF